MMKFLNVLGYKVYSDDLSKIVLEKDCFIINTISPNSYGLATKNKDFEIALKESDYLVLDGVYFALASILLHGKNIKKNQGPDVFYHFINRLDKMSGKAFFLGSSEETLFKIKENLKARFPNIRAETYSPPYKVQFSKDENQNMIDRINTFNPDILFVGMTAPKQEIWLISNRKYLSARLALGIGGVFDWFAGNYKEIPKIWWTLRLGWLVRAVQRPELLKRNIPNYYIFAKDVVKQLVKKIK